MAVQIQLYLQDERQNLRQREEQSTRKIVVVKKHVLVIFYHRSLNNKVDIVVK
jgi:hypothetical protein